MPLFIDCRWKGVCGKDLCQFCFLPKYGLKWRKELSNGRYHTVMPLLLCPYGIHHQGIEASVCEVTSIIARLIGSFILLISLLSFLYQHQVINIRIPPLASTSLFSFPSPPLPLSLLLFEVITAEEFILIVVSICNNYVYLLGQLLLL